LRNDDLLWSRLLFTKVTQAVYNSKSPQHNHKKMLPQPSEIQSETRSSFFSPVITFGTQTCNSNCTCSCMCTGRCTNGCQSLSMEHQEPVVHDRPLAQLLQVVKPLKC